MSDKDKILELLQARREKVAAETGHPGGNKPFPTEGLADLLQGGLTQLGGAVVRESSPSARLARRAAQNPIIQGLGNYGNRLANTHGTGMGEGQGRSAVNELGLSGLGPKGLGNIANNLY